MRRVLGQEVPGRFPRVFVMDLSRRLGKDFTCLLIRIEDAIRKPNSMLTYATAYQKDIKGIVLPLFEKLIEDCPKHLKPKLVGASRTGEPGIHFPNGSIIRLAGIDRGLDGLRGRHSDGVTISEAGFVDYLEDAIVSVLMPQLLGFPDADIILNSTPPQIPGHAYDDVFVPDSIERSAYVKRVLTDCPRYSAAECEEFIRSAGGRESEKARREYFCERIRSESRVVIPEFNESLHVVASPFPTWAYGISALDPGITDMTAVLCGYWDFERAKLVVRKDWGRSGATTKELHAALVGVEGAVFQDLRYWQGDKPESNPRLRVSDTDMRLITDLRKEFGLSVSAADKVGKDAALSALRNAFLNNKIEIHPDAKLTIAHVKNAVWNKAHTSYVRSETFGHFDAVDALVYMYRHCERHFNPNPPAAYQRLLDGENINALHFPKNRQEFKAHEEIESILPGRNRKR